MLEFRNLSKKRIEYGAYKKLYKKIFKKGFELSVVIAPHALMKKLNKTYRGKEKAANVLSFMLEKDAGEIFLNAGLPTQAGENDLRYLFVHGSLHLLGYDHKKNKDAEKMENLEKKILNKK